MGLSFSDLPCKGKGECSGGVHVVPPIDEFPLLAWRGDDAKFDDKVFTSDYAVSVDEIMAALVETSDIRVLASRFGTTKEHVAQAVAYMAKVRTA